MPVLTPSNNPKKSSNKTVFRNTTRCLKLTEEEARLVDEIATAKGMPRSEWMRDTILRELRVASESDPILSEIVGIRLLLINVLRPLADGQKMTNQAFDKLLEHIGTRKQEIVQKMLSAQRR